METRVCGKCKQEKPVTEFYKSKRDGYRSRCKACSREDCKEYAKTGYYKRYNKEYNNKTGYYTLYQREWSKKPENRTKINKRKREYHNRPEVRIRRMANWYLAHEIRAGRIHREPCALCGSLQVEGHHPDYCNPLLIVWLCPECHRKYHKNLKKGE